MKCKKCEKIIKEAEIYCEECKGLLKKESELNKLINENKELNKLEITKEVETLKSFKDVKEESSSALKEELKDIVNIEEIELGLVEKNNKKNIVVIILIILTFIIIGLIVMLLVINNHPQEIKKEEKIDYEKIINNYGKLAATTVEKYLEDNEEVPSWPVISNLINYKEYEVVCYVHTIYSDGSIYLNNCKVDGKEVEYSYGIEKQETKAGKIIEVYKHGDENYHYSIKNENNALLVGKVTCKTDSCEFVDAFDKFVLIKEDNNQYIYNYEDDSLKFGPINITARGMSYDNELYGMIYESNGKNNIYTLSTDKIFENLEGELLSTAPFFEPTVMYKYGYAILKKDNINNFLNLKTGNISYSINGALNEFIENPTNKLVYITTLNPENSKITIYNSNGKKLFEGKEYNDINLVNDSLIVSTDNNFYVYDLELKLSVKSKFYNKIFDIQSKDFITVLDNEILKLVDLEDNILTTFDIEWNNEKYSYERELSGWYNDNEIKIIIANKDSSGILQNYIECNYNILTKENSITETNAN